MADGMKDIIKRLEQQRVAIERALTALKEVDGITETAASPAPNPSPATTKRGRRKGGMTPAGRKRLSESLRARWAAKRAGNGAPAAATKSAAPKKAASKRGRKKSA